MQETIKTVADATGGMSVAAFLAIITALVTVITILGEVIKTQIQKKANPLNGTLSKLDTSIGNLNTTMTRIEMRTMSSDQALLGHTEKLILLASTVGQLAANEARQTDVMRGMQETITEGLTGCADRMTEHCDARSEAVIRACSPRS